MKKRLSRREKKLRWPGKRKGPSIAMASQGIQLNDSFKNSSQKSPKGENILVRIEQEDYSLSKMTD